MTGVHSVPGRVFLVVPGTNFGWGRSWVLRAVAPVVLRLPSNAARVGCGVRILRGSALLGVLATIKPKQRNQLLRTPGSLFLSFFATTQTPKESTAENA